MFCHLRVCTRSINVPLYGAVIRASYDQLTLRHPFSYSRAYQVDNKLVARSSIGGRHRNPYMTVRISAGRERPLCIIEDIAAHAVSQWIRTKKIPRFTKPVWTRWCPKRHDDCQKINMVYRETGWNQVRHHLLYPQNTRIRDVSKNPSRYIVGKA
jgi:hypothetical protein